MDIKIQKRIITNGTLIPGATESSYEPDIKEAGKTYYYCRIRYQLKAYTKKQNKTINSGFVIFRTPPVSPSQKPLFHGRETEVKVPHTFLRQLQMSRHCATR